MNYNMNAERLLERFLRYVQIDTTAREGVSGYPSSPGQFELGKLLVEELRAIGLTEIEHNRHGIVTATLAGNSAKPSPTIAWVAHLDTSPETTGAGVKPQVVRNYASGDLVLPGDATKVIRTADNPELLELLGMTIVTTDGTTLLGADDKAGIAAIMEALAYLAEHPRAPRCTVKACFTCDEEIGHGVDHVDLARLAAAAAYTLDGGGANQIDVETFSADLAIVTMRGVNIHPSIGKDRMVNAVRGASALVAALPRDRLSPETSDGRQGFLHPYHLEGGVDKVTLRVLLRDFDTAVLAHHAAKLQAAADQVMRDLPGLTIEIEIVQQYRNMGEGLAKEPRAAAYAEEALQRLGRTPELTIIRGGTDGSRLTELGLPTPNLSTGEHNPHSPLEWTCLEEMVQAAEGLVSLAEIWTK